MHVRHRDAAHDRPDNSHISLVRAAQEKVVQVGRAVKLLVGSTINGTVVMPGETTEINVSYNAAKAGKFNKVVKVYLKGQKEPELLIIQGEVKSKEG